MDTILVLVLLLLFVTDTLCVFNHKVVPACKKHEKVCKFEFDVRYKFSMVYTDDNGHSTPVIIQNGTIMKKSLSKHEEMALTPTGKPPSLPSYLSTDSLNLDFFFRSLDLLNGNSTFSLHELFTLFII